jgi:hypothetical protein
VRASAFLGRMAHLWPRLGPRVALGNAGLRAVDRWASWPMRLTTGSLHSPARVKPYSRTRSDSAVGLALEWQRPCETSAPRCGVRALRWRAYRHVAFRGVKAPRAASRPNGTCAPPWRYQPSSCTSLCCRARMTVRIVGVKLGHATSPCLSGPSTSAVLWRSAAVDEANHANRDGLLDVWDSTA